MHDNYIYMPVPSANYKRTRRRAQKQGLDMDLLDWCIEQLAKEIPLPLTWKDHQLKGKMKHLRECHIGGSGGWLYIFCREAAMEVSLRKAMLSL